MGEIEVTGPQAGAALDYALAGRLSAIRVGRAKYSLLCDADGGVLDDLVVYRLAEQRYLVVANAANVEPDLAALGGRGGRLRRRRDRHLGPHRAARRAGPAGRRHPHRAGPGPDRDRPT